MSQANSNSTNLKKSIDPAALAQLLSSQKTPLNWYEWLSDEQRDAVDFLVKNLKRSIGCGLLADPGTGKTIISMAVLQVLAPKSVLIVAPLTSLEVTWAKRLRNLYPNIVNHVDDYKGEGVLLIGYEQFRSKKSINKIVRKFKFDFALFDESQGLKHRSSNQSKAVRRLRMRVPMRVILSGTPVDDSPIDLWAQMRFIAPECLGDVWTAPRDPRKYEGPYFAEDFCRKAGFMGKQWEFRQDQIDEFLKRISPYLYRLTNDLESAETIPVFTQLFGQQREIYEEMESKGIVYIDDTKSKAAHQAVRDLRCFQIVGGNLTMDDGTNISVGNAKQRKLSWLIKRLDKPVVFCRFLPELADVKEILGKQFKRVALLHGAIKDKKNDKARTRLLESFQGGKIDAMAVQARTGGVSVEFTASRDCVFYSMGYSYIDFQQIIARFRRHGQEKRVRVWLIIARDTIDEQPLERIMTKSENVEPIMKHIKERSMADAKKAAKKTAKKAPAKKAAKTEIVKKAIGVDYLSDKHDISESAVRGRLREHNVAKAGKAYGWDSKGEADKAWAKTEKKAA